MRRVLLLLALAGCQRCGAHGAGDAATTSSVVDASVSVEAAIEGMLPKDLADTPPFGNDVKRAVCGQSIKGTCDILQQTSAGKDAAGRELVVVTVRTREPYDSGASGYWDPEDGVEGREHWVIARKDGAIVSRVPIAMEDAHTDVEIKSSLTIGTNELQLAAADVAPSSWNWTPSYKFQLSPPALLEFSDAMYNSNPSMEGSSGTHLDLATGSGEGSFHCPTRAGQFFPVPSLTNLRAIDPAHGLGTCAGDVDGAPKHGYMVAGTPDKPNGYFRVASIEALVIEVHDDKFTPGDRLELRIGRSASGMGCDFFRPIARRVAIDGTGMASQTGLIDVKKIRDEPNVRTFELRFADPKHFDLWSGFAIDMIDDDGSGVPRKLSTAAVGPELGSAAQIQLGACLPGAGGPVAAPLFKVETSSTKPAAKTGASLVGVVGAWNDATNEHDAAKLQRLYADEVELYGTKMTRTKAVAIKNAAFAAHDSDTLSDINVTKNRATFSKHSRLKNKTSIWVDGYIEVDASMRIIAEGDTTTDENLAAKKERECLAALDAVLPKSNRRGIDHDGPRWAVRDYANRPGSKPEDHESILTDEYEIDALKGTILHAGKPMPGDVSACK